jgi:cyclically-permuted mutarotase family protein
MARFVAALIAGLCCVSCTQRPEGLQPLQWSRLPDLPAGPGREAQPGVAGPFIGVSNGAVLVAGGANFPERPPWEGGPKVYYDDIFVLDGDAGGKIAWRTGSTLPRPLAYGASVQTPDGVICIGGSDGKETHRDVFRMTWDPKAKQVTFADLPALPAEIEHPKAALFGNVLYVASGKEGGQWSNAFRALDLSNREGEAGHGWQRLPDYPGPGHVQSVAAAQKAGAKGRVYLFSGWCYPRNAREPYVSTTGWAYDIASREWRGTAPIAPGGRRPRAVCAGSALAMGDRYVLVLGGRGSQNLGSILNTLRRRDAAKAAGDDAAFRKLDAVVLAYFTDTPFRFNRDVLLYDTAADRWHTLGTLPFPPVVTTTLVSWRGGVVHASGEVRPGVRTPRVYFGE